MSASQVTGAVLANFLNDTNLTAIKAEIILDGAIDLLNLRGCELSNMAGTEASKTVTLTSEERGAVFYVSRAIYASINRGGSGPSGSIGPLNLNVKDLLSDPNVLAAVDEAAEDLKKLNIEWSEAFI